MSASELTPGRVSVPWRVELRRRHQIARAARVLARQRPAIASAAERAR